MGEARSGERICIVGAGAAGLAAAWALDRHRARWDVHVFEANDRIGGNALTVDVPQRDGSTVPIDVSVTAFIPSVYHTFVRLLSLHGIEQVPTRFSYAVRYGEDVYAHDFDSALKDALAPDLARFAKLLSLLGRFNVLNRRPSLALSALNPFNYVSMRTMLDVFGVSNDFRFKVLKPLFVNFVLATNVFDMPASMFSRYLDFFGVEKATPMVTWKGGTRRIYERLTEGFADRIHLRRRVVSIRRSRRGVDVRDASGRVERFDRVVLACNANHALTMLAEPSRRERWVLGRVRYETDLHSHAVVHTDASVLPDDDTRVLETRSTFVRHYGARPDNYEITYLMHNQQPWAKSSDVPCLVTYNANAHIDESRVLAHAWFQHVVHDVFHTVVLLKMFQTLQGRRRTHYCGAHTTVNSQEHCFLSGLAVARQIGADYPFAEDREAVRWFNFYGRLMHGRAFRSV
jgi:predicted NAD/FAD-binding protein